MACGLLIKLPPPSFRRMSIQIFWLSLEIQLRALVLTWIDLHWDPSLCHCHWLFMHRTTNASSVSVGEYFWMIQRQNTVARNVDHHAFGPIWNLFYNTLVSKFFKSFGMIGLSFVLLKKYLPFFLGLRLDLSAILLFNVHKQGISWQLNAIVKMTSCMLNQPNMFVVIIQMFRKRN